MSRRVAVSLMLLVLLGAVWYAADPLAVAAQAPQRASEVVIARNHTHAFHLLAPSVALEKGFFKGVTVRMFNRDLLPEFMDGDKMADAMQANGIDVVVDARVRTLFNQKARRLVIVGDWQAGTLDDVKLMSMSKIRSVADLKGQRIAISGRDSESSEILNYWLTQAKLDPERDVKWVMGLSRNTTAAKALREGKVEAAFTNASDAAQLIKEGFYVLLDYKKLYPDGRVERIIAATRELAEQRPQELKNFLKGMVRGYRLLSDWKKNESFLKTLWEKEIQRVVGGESAAASGENYESTPLSPDGIVRRKAIQTALEEQQSLGKVDKNLKLQDILKLEQVEQAVKELKAEGIAY